MKPLELGKIPPQAVDFEKAVLSASILYSNASDVTLEIIKDPEVFYDNRHALIYQAIIDLDRSNKPKDLLTVSEQLKTMGKLEAAGGDFYLIEISKMTASTAHLEHHCLVLMQKYISRQMIRLASEVIEWGYDESRDVFDSLEELGKGFDRIKEMTQIGERTATWAEAIMDVSRRVEWITNNKGELTGVDTGLGPINRMFNGWQPSNLIILGADSGMGKTALAMTYILACAKQGKAVGVCSMEMSVQELGIRAVAVESNFHLKQLTQEGFEEDKYFTTLAHYQDQLVGLPVYVDDRPSVTVQEAKRRARQMKRQHNIQLYVVDFIQMFGSEEEDENKAVGRAARELKNLAKELKIPVIALSQLNREVKKAKFNIPSKHHLKNSSGVEEAADVITLLYRPGYYEFSREEYPGLWNDDLGLTGEENAALIVAKNRNGGLGKVGLKFIENKTKYVDPQPLEVPLDLTGPFKKEKPEEDDLPY